MYEDVYRLCENVERVVGMFSEELRILDRNTVQYMIDELQAEIDSQKIEIDNQKTEIADKDARLQKELRENKLLRQRVVELEKAISQNQ